MDIYIYILAYAYACMHAHQCSYVYKRMRMHIHMSTNKLNRNDWGRRSWPGALLEKASLFHLQSRIGPFENCGQHSY